MPRGVCACVGAAVCICVCAMAGLLWLVSGTMISADRKPALGELALEIQRARADRLGAGHRPEDLELEAVGILGVEREARAVIGGADERARLDEAAPRAR